MVNDRESQEKGKRDKSARWSEKCRLLNIMTNGYWRRTLVAAIWRNNRTENYGSLWHAWRYHEKRLDASPGIVVICKEVRKLTLKRIQFKRLRKLLGDIMDSTDLDGGHDNFQQVCVSSSGEATGVSAKGLI